MGKVYVYEGYIPRGGTYMAYHLGLILHRHFGLPVSVVGHPRPADSPFDYPLAFPVIEQDDFLATCHAEDLLICNPSFSDNMFGLALPCRKLCYVQHVNSFRYLDGFFDDYVFVSHFVKTFIESLYDISGPVIPAFVNVPAAGTLRPLAERADRALLLSWKTPEPVYRRFQAYCRKAALSAATSVDVLPVVPQGDLAAEMRASRYFVSLATYEGFGLPMLEAMANGCAVVGLASGGNSEYAQDGENCRLFRYPRLDDLADALACLSSGCDEASRLAAAGRAAAEGFGYQKFEARWKDLFERIL